MDIYRKLRETLQKAPPHLHTNFRRSQLKYAEIGIKGKNRYKFENALCEQIRCRLAKIDGEFEVVREAWKYTASI